MRSLNPARDSAAAKRSSSAGVGESGPPANWPHRELSRHVMAGGHQWHLQRGGSGPACMLIHGTGASTHTWDGLLPLLMANFDCLAPDLPGQGFSQAMPHEAPTLPNMSGALAALLGAEDFKPEVVIGHSAGAALALRLALDGVIAPRLIVGLNSALLPYGGWLAPLAQPLARAFSALTPVQNLLASRARNPGTVERLIASTGSRLETQGIDQYRQLLGRKSHVDATVTMMANWDLKPLLKDLPGLTLPVCLVVGEDDRTVSPSEASEVLALLPRARVIRLPGLGHLAHEEKPAVAFEAIEEAIRWSTKSG